MKPIDYRELLKKYIAHVVEQEGLSFIDSPYTDGDRGRFSADELTELKALDAEL